MAPGSRDGPGWAVGFIYAVLLLMAGFVAQGPAHCALTIEFWGWCRPAAAQVITRETALQYAVNKHKLELALRGIVTSHGILRPDPDR